MNLQSIINDLEVIADWRDELHSRIRRFSLRFEFVGLEAAEQQQLAAEVQCFNHVCRSFSTVIKGETA